MKLISGFVIFFILIVVIGYFLAKKEYEEKGQKPSDEMYPLF